MSVIGLLSSMGLGIYLERAYSESPMLDALKSLLFFWADRGEPAMRAPPLINLSHTNTLLGWAALTGIVAVVGLVRASMARDRVSQGQPRSIAVIVSLLTMYCLWDTWPFLVELARR